MYKQQQLCNSVIMAYPEDFGFNPETGIDNEFQHCPSSENEANSIKLKVIVEFERMVETLGNAGLEVLIIKKPTSSSPIPDAIFPNNWFSTRSDGHLYIYPMKTLNRQAEVQISGLKNLFDKHNYQLSNVVDLRRLTDDSVVTSPALEGTGSLVFHHPTSSIFAALSERCDYQALHEFAEAHHYNLYEFETKSQNGLPIYHTNVVMSCGERFSVITEQIMSRNQKSKKAIDRLNAITDDLIVINEQQMTESFCGNILQLMDKSQQPVIVMSESAKNGFTAAQISQLELHGSLVICSIPTIEYVGGGSARCMVAENFLPSLLSSK